MFTITPITQGQVDALDEKLATAGTSVRLVSANNYVLANDRHGINASAVFDPVARALTVEITKKPLLMPESLIKHGIEEALKS